MSVLTRIETIVQIVIKLIFCIHLQYSRYDKCFKNKLCVLNNNVHSEYVCLHTGRKISEKIYFKTLQQQKKIVLRMSKEKLLFLFSPM